MWHSLVVEPFARSGVPPPNRLPSVATLGRTLSSYDDCDYSGNILSFQRLAVNRNSEVTIMDTIIACLAILSRSAGYPHPTVPLRFLLL
jgi:hypothetical protein